MHRTPVDLASLEPRRVCLIKPSSLGDVVHATPVLAALRLRWPSAHLAWVINKGLAGLVEGLPELDEVIQFDRGQLRASSGGVTATGRFLAGLRKGRFDLAIDLQGLLRSGIMAWASGAQVRVGLSDAREGAPWFYSHRVTMPAEETHAVDRLMLVAAAFGAPIETPRFLVAMRKEDRSWARAVLTGISGPRLVLNVGARWVTKRWPPERFAAVARRAVEQSGASLIAVGAPEDRPLIDALKLALDPIPILDLAGRTTLPQLAALASESDLFLSNDTGPLHLAVATGTQVVAVFTCTRPEKTGPYGPNTAVVRSGIWCAGSCVKTCPRMECMDELSPEKVWRVVSARLKSGGRGHHSAA
jgi:heptosyltransferase I